MGWTRRRRYVADRFLPPSVQSSARRSAASLRRASGRPCGRARRRRRSSPAGLQTLRSPRPSRRRRPWWRCRSRRRGASRLEGFGHRGLLLGVSIPRRGFRPKAIVFPTFVDAGHNPISTMTRRKALGGICMMVFPQDRAARRRDQILLAGIVLALAFLLAVWLDHVVRISS